MSEIYVNVQFILNLDVKQPSFQEVV